MLDLAERMLTVLGFLLSFPEGIFTLFAGASYPALKSTDCPQGRAQLWLLSTDCYAGISHGIVR